MAPFRVTHPIGVGPAARDGSVPKQAVVGIQPPIPPLTGIRPDSANRTPGIAGQESRHLGRTRSASTHVRLAYAPWYGGTGGGTAGGAGWPGVMSSSTSRPAAGRSRTVPAAPKAAPAGPKPHPKP